MSQRSAEQRCALPEMSATGHTDVPEIGWAGAVDTVKSSYGHLVKDPLAHWQPMKHITKNWGDVLKLAGADDQKGSSVQDHLQLTDDLRRMLP